MNNIDFRADFPLLSSGKAPIYFDNACLTLVPRPVIEAVSEYYTLHPACGGRSSHRLAVQVTAKVQATREAVAKLINAKESKEIVFVKNTSEGLNLVARAMTWQAGDTVLTTDKEHNSNLIIWRVLVEEKGIVHKVVPSDSDGNFDLELYRKMVAEASNLKLVSMVYVSNLDGTSIPAKEVIEIAHVAGALVMLDGAQAVPHKAVDVRALNVDFMAFAGHKMLGPSATGLLYGRYDVLSDLGSFIVGGQTVSTSTYNSYELLPAPERFEAGLQNYAGIIALGAAIKYLQNVGFDYIVKTELEINNYITSELGALSKVHIIGPAVADLRGGIFNFYLDGMDSHQVSVMLDEMSAVLVRSGQHCVHSWFAEHKVTNSVRASFYFYNTLAEAELLVANVKKIVKLI